MQPIQKSEALNRLHNKMESFANIPDDEFEKLKQVMYEKSFKKGEVILRPGQVCRQYYFIVSGCVRSFSLKDDKEINLSFFFEEDIACDFESFRSEQPSLVYLVTTEDCEVLYTNKKEVIPIFSNEEPWHTYLFRFFQHLYLEKDKHAATLKLLSPEERYNYLITNYPEYFQRVPLIYIASYLGISRETLNRVRKKLS